MMHYTLSLTEQEIHHLTYALAILLDIAGWWEETDALTMAEYEEFFIDERSLDMDSIIRILAHLKQTIEASHV